MSKLTIINAKTMEICSSNWVSKPFAKKEVMCFIAILMAEPPRYPGINPKIWHVRSSEKSSVM